MIQYIFTSLFLINILKLKIGKGDTKVDQKATNDLVQTLSLFLEVPNLRDCVSISTVVHATISYLFSRHFPAFSVPRPILKVSTFMKWFFSCINMIDDIGIQPPPTSLIFIKFLHFRLLELYLISRIKLALYTNVLELLPDMSTQ